MNEQWHKALEQVEDRHLEDAVSYRQRLPVLRFAGAAAAVLVLAAAWFAIGRGLPPWQTPATDSLSAGAPPGMLSDSAVLSPDGSPQYGTDRGEAAVAPGSAVTGGSKGDSTPTDPNLLTNYEQLKQRCLSGQTPELDGSLRIPCLDYTPMAPTDGIYLSQKKLYGKPWVGYGVRVGEKKYTVQVCTELFPHTACAQLIQQLDPNAPNLHNAKDFPQYTTIEETGIITYDGAKTALLYQTEDRFFLHFLQDGALVILIGEGNPETDWLSRFHLYPVTGA